MKENSRTILFYVNSQFGLGHFQRTYCILEELERSYPDFQPLVLCGGLAFPKFSTLENTVEVRLPGLSFQSSDGSVGYRPEPIEQGRRLGDVLAERRAAIADAVRGRDIAVVVLEYFPFSKQSLRDEVHQLILESSKEHTPIVVSSTRDFVTIDEGFDRDYAESFIEGRCDYVFVHADSRYARLESTYGCVSRFSGKTRYTGFVVDSALLQRRSLQRPPVLAVSMGGGRDGTELARMFCEAITSVRAMGLGGLEVCVFPGPYLPSNTYRELEKLADGLADLHIRLCQFSEYREIMPVCSASLSMCGYNTVWELVAAGVPRVGLFPRNRTEQLMRCALLEEQRLAQELRSISDVSTFISSCSQNTTFSSARNSGIDLDGATTTACLLASIAMEKAV